MPTNWVCRSASVSILGKAPGLAASVPRGGRHYADGWLRSATSIAATLIGYGDRLGTIEKGKLADLISVPGNPIQDIRVMRQIRLVMKDGVRYDTLSRR